MFNLVVVVRENQSMASVVASGVLEVQLYYEDTDFSGIVYHSNYLKYFERGRDELMGIDKMRRAYQEGIAAFVQKVSDLTFRGVSKHSDILVVETKLVKLGKLRMIFEQEARVKVGGKGEPGEVICSAKTDVAFIDVNTQQLKPVPDYLLSM